MRKDLGVLLLEYVGCLETVSSSLMSSLSLYISLTVLAWEDFLDSLFRLSSIVACSERIVSFCPSISSLSSSLSLNVSDSSCSSLLISSR